ncbi:hypothetical protein [Streptomyces palmae]|uniref:Uncharacterized protein n=1 Tax=Streptomyces palmae TaxID=1701085 RepID=A0A4Z0HA73_9ACTN|nr:hypothetical protein [Streptomyces palmae]TGB07814.1 hypothetical protein E4099_16575 [Streptomyces palmae]
MTAYPLPGSVLLGRDETDVVERALFIALYHRRSPADGEPSVETFRSLFDELRRIRSTERPQEPESRWLAADGVQLQHGRVDRVLISGSAWFAARSALLLACFDDTLCEHDFQTIVGWPRSDFHTLAAQCEVLDAEGLRAELFRARALGDGIRHRKLLTFALDHMGMNPTSRDVESVERSLSELDSTCDVEALTDLLARAQAKALKPPCRSKRPKSDLRGQRPCQ